MMNGPQAMRLARTTVTWLLLAVCAGAILGAAARIGMRIVALEADGPTGFSFGGSLEVVAFGVIVGAPAAIAFWLFHRWKRLPRGTGVFMGFLLFLILALAPPPAARSALAATPDSPVVTSVVFAIAFAIYGAVLDMIGHMMTSSRRPELPAQLKRKT